MAILNPTQLSSAAQGIATATAAGSNTAAIVGGLFQDIVDSGVFTVKVSVSSAQLLALSSFSPLMLIAAKGAGKLIRPIAFTFKLNYGTTTYTGGSLQIYYASGGSFMVQNSSYTNSSSIMYYAPIANTFIFDQSAINNNLVLSVSSAISNGDSTLDIYITYEVITI